MTRWLVVDADDAGADAARDAAILEAFDRGIVRSASVIANGATAEAFLSEAKRRPGLGVGVHLNLTEGRALAGPAHTLTDAAGAFPGDMHEVWRRGVDGRVDPAEVEVELLAQVERIRALYGAIDHVDGHGHVHALPGYRDGLLRALPTLGAAIFVRVPAEADPPVGAMPVSEPELPLGDTTVSDARWRQIRAGHRGIACVGVHADVLRLRIRGRCRITDGFGGIWLASCPNLPSLELALRATKGRVVELMAHPGLVVPGARGAPGDAQREMERSLLCDPGARAAVDAAGFTLSSFRDVPV